MDDLSKLSASGGNDLYGAGTWSLTGSDVATITLTGTSGTASVTVNGVTKVATFATDLTTTASNFVTAFAADYLAIGITLTSSTVNLIFTVASGTIVVDPAIANASGNLSGTILKSGFRLPHPVYAFNVVATAVVSSAKKIYLGGVIKPVYPKFLGASLAVSTVPFVFEYAIAEITIVSGTLIMNHIK